MYKAVKNHLLKHKASRTRMLHLFGNHPKRKHSDPADSYLNTEVLWFLLDSWMWTRPNKTKTQHNPTQHPLLPWATNVSYKTCVEQIHLITMAPPLYYSWIKPPLWPVARHAYLHTIDLKPPVKSSVFGVEVLVHILYNCLTFSKSLILCTTSDLKGI